MEQASSPKPPDGTTLWLFRETLAKAGLVAKLFERFGQHLEAKGYIARGGQMVDATIVPVPKQRNSRDENDEVKAGKTPEAWEKNPAKNRQKDKDARWTKKHDKSFYGYKNHVNADAKHKLIRQYDVTDVSVHDSQKFDGLLNQANTSSNVYADQRVSFGGDRGEAQPARIAQPDSSSREPQSSAIPSAGGHRSQQAAHALGRRGGHCLVRRFLRLHRFRSRGTRPCARPADTRTIWSHPGRLRPEEIPRLRIVQRIGETRRYEARPGCSQRQGH
jgi:IS5 family transposase